MVYNFVIGVTEVSVTGMRKKLFSSNLLLHPEATAQLLSFRMEEEIEEKRLWPTVHHHSGARGDVTVGHSVFVAVS